MQNFDREKILDIQQRLRDRENKPDTEEATKLWFIMPLIQSLGYNLYSNEVIPEYTLDVGVKKGEKVDYALQINNQPVALVECKQLSVQLSDKYISQLYRYFAVSDVNIAILTNGDDYWFFTDSQKDNIMDLEPYFKIKLSEAEIDDINKLEAYSKDNIQHINIAQEVQCEKFKAICKDFVFGLKTSNIPGWLLDTLAERSGLSNIDIDKSILAGYLIDAIDVEFGDKTKEKKKTKQESSLGAKMKDNMEKNRKNISNIKLNHEYIYNDYSDGDWKFHTLDYAIIRGTKFEDINGRSLLINVATDLLKNNLLTREQILENESLKGFISTDGEYRNAHYFDDYNLYMATAFGIDGIVRNIKRLLTAANLDDSCVVVSFKA